MSELAAAQVLRRESVNHPCFPQPADRNARIWRYFSWVRFMDAVRSRTLWLSRSDLLGDPCEGSRPRGDALLIENAKRQIESSGGNRLQFYQARATLQRMDREAKASTFISCWQMKHHDMMQMWERYCNPRPLGVALQTTYARLDAALPFVRAPHQNVMLGLVTYGDYDDAGFRSDFTNGYSAFMLKKVQYEDEDEVRVLCDMLKPSEEKGVRVRVDWGSIIERVVVSPYGGLPFTKAVQMLCRNLGYTFPVVRSSAREVISY
jgi:hypothetical protein